MNKLSLMCIKKTAFVFLATSAMGLSAMAQDKAEVTLQADFVSDYIWRGLDLDGPSIQPALNLGWKGLNVMASASIGTTSPDDLRELDLTVSYTLGGFSLGVVDYWDNSAGVNYLTYTMPNTNHLFEGFVAYDFGFLQASWQTYFAGADSRTIKGKRAYSSYVELNAPFRLGSFDWTATLGAVPYRSENYGTNGFSVINIGLRAAKDIPITDRFSLPVFGQLVLNPRSEQAYMIVGVSLKAF